MELHRDSRHSTVRTAKTEIPIATKLQILGDIDSNVSPKLVSRKYNVSISAIGYILKKRKKVEEAAELNEGRKRMVRTTKYQQINNMMLEFYSRCQAVLIPLTSPLLQTVSRQFATALGMHSFTGSNGWVAAFLHRNRITSFAKRGENKEDRKRRMLTDHQHNMVDTIVHDLITNKDNFTGEDQSETVVVPPVEHHLDPAPLAEPAVVNVTFEPLGTVELIPHRPASSLPVPDRRRGLGRTSAKRSSSGDLRISNYAQAIQALTALQRYAYEKGSSTLLPMLGEIAAVLSREEVEKAQKKPLNFKKRRIRTENQQDNVESSEQLQTLL